MIALPPILGYNTVRLSAGFDVIATWGDSDDPAIATGQFGDGRVLAYFIIGTNTIGSDPMF